MIPSFKVNKNESHENLNAWQRANIQNVSLGTLYSGQFALLFNQ